MQNLELDPDLDAAKSLDPDPCTTTRDAYLHNTLIHLFIRLRF